MLDVLVIGAGPVGLACAIEAARHQLTARVIDKGTLVNSIAGYPAQMEFFSTPDLTLNGRPLGTRIADRVRELRTELSADETAVAQEIVRVASRSDISEEVARFRGAARKLFRANLRSVRAQALSSPLMDVIGAVAIALLLLLGRDKIRMGTFTLGTFATFIYAVFSKHVLQASLGYFITPLLSIAPNTLR